MLGKGSGEGPDLATVEEVQQAIQELSNVDYFRLLKVARHKTGGSVFTDPAELVSQAVLTPYLAARGDGGRRWKKGTNFIAFLTKTIQGLASDSRGSAQQRLTVSNLVPGQEGEPDHDIFERPCFAKASVEEQVIAQETDRCSEPAEAVRELRLAEVKEYFKNDEEVGWIIKGIEEEKNAQEIQSLSGMSATQYATARRRWRRGLEAIARKRRTP